MSKAPWPSSVRAAGSLAELDIDPAQLAAYKAALKEEIAASIRLEPGVLRLYAVSIKDHPIRFASRDVSRSDVISSPPKLSDFKRYKLTTQHMVKSLTLIETEPCC